MIDLDAIADEMLDLLGTGRTVQPLSQRLMGWDLETAYKVTPLVRARREARGEHVVGRKIGFTNRTIWDSYHVHAPIWGYVYDTTMFDLTVLKQPFSVSHLSQPRIEPEIIFGLGAAPKAGMTPEALLGCIEWAAHGFEIVQSVFPDWKFVPADPVAAYGLHGALHVGRKHRIDDAGRWMRELADFEIDLVRDGVPMLHGRGANVLDSPLLALRHLVELLGASPEMPQLAAGEVVTTGTLTDALPIKAGESWSTRLSGIGLDDAALRIA